MPALGSIRQLLVFVNMLLISLPLFATETALDELFDKLRQSQSEVEARALENRIWLHWFQSGNEAVDNLMKQAMERRRWYDFDGSIDILNQVIDIMPDFAEAWNQRATVHFQQQKFEKSLDDIARTLELEPRHFGALAGRALIRLHQNRPALALQNFREASKIHPFLKERHLFGKLSII